MFRRAYQAMRSGKSGPVLIEVPEEFWEAEFEGELNYEPVPFSRIGARSGRGQGRGAQDHAPTPRTRSSSPARACSTPSATELIELANLLPAPVMTTNPGKSAIPREPPPGARRLDSLAAAAVRPSS